MKKATAKIKPALERSFVSPLFAKLRKSYRPAQSLPQVIAENRLTRAQDRLLTALVSRGSATLPPDLKQRIESIALAWMAKFFDDAFPPIQKLEFDCARDHDLVSAQESGDKKKILDVLERDYRQRVIQQYGSIELRGIQLNHRVTLNLDRVYVPLHLEEQRTEAGPLLRNRMPVVEALSKHQSLLVIGSPGSGKSTLVSALANGCAADKLPEGTGWKPRSLPLVLAVRTLKSPLLTSTSMSGGLDIPKEVLERALEEKRVILFVDGLDEAPKAFRQDLIASLTKFVSSHREVSVLVTSRPAGPAGEIESCLPGSGVYRLADLTKPEIDEFIDKWCIAAETSARGDESDARKQAQGAADDLKSRIARSMPIQRIAVNPLLTTILCVVHRFLGRSIPEHRVELYDKCTDALLYEWDHAKFSERAVVGTLDASQKRDLLCRVARFLHDNHQAEISEEEVTSNFAEVLPDLGQSPSGAKQIVDEIRDRSGLLVERRPGVFGFSHLTFQEYFTALSYASPQDVRQLITRWKDPWWHEVIALSAGIPGTNAEVILSGLLARKHIEATILAAICLETAIKVPLKVRREIETRLDKLIPPPNDETIVALREIGVMVAPLLTKKLGQARGEDKFRILDLLSVIDFDPAVPAILLYSCDPYVTQFSIPGFNFTIGEFAILVLGNKSLESETAARAFAVAMRETQSLRFLKYISTWQFSDESKKIVADALEAARQGTPDPMPAKNTPKSPPNTQTADGKLARNTSARTRVPSHVGPLGKASRNAPRRSTPV